MLKAASGIFWERIRTDEEGPEPTLIAFLNEDSQRERLRLVQAKDVGNRSIKRATCPQSGNCRLNPLAPADPRFESEPVANARRHRRR
jgi:hypothetical protein